MKIGRPIESSMRGRVGWIGWAVLNRSRSWWIVRQGKSGCWTVVMSICCSYFRPNLLHMEKLVFTSFSAFAEEWWVCQCLYPRERTFVSFRLVSESTSISLVLQLLGQENKPGMNIASFRPHSSSHRRCRIHHNSWAHWTRSLIAASRRTRSRPRRLGGLGRSGPCRVFARSETQRLVQR